MIVQVNADNAQRYAGFLQEAYEYLEAANQLNSYDINSNKTFEDISQYYNYVEYFKNCDRRDYFLLKLPLDEEILKIDANSRNIELPQSFKNGSIVQRDKLSETVVFTIDRFIDNMDLANAENIYVQWTAPDGNGGIREKATPIEYIDLEDKPGKIKFGWPIDEDVTLFAGTVEFSVAFFIFDDLEENKVIYRLNTLPFSFTVKEALQPEINGEESLNRPHTDLHSALRNNQYPGKGLKAPRKPSFSLGEDLPTSGIVETSRELRARATVGVGTGEVLGEDEDCTGTISYRWEYCPENGVLNYDCAGGTYESRAGLVINPVDYNLITGISTIGTSPATVTKENALSQNKEGDKVVSYTFKDKYTVTYGSFGSIGEVYVATPKNEFEVSDKIYEQKAGGGYKIFTGDLETTKATLYQKYTRYELPPEGETEKETVQIVGKYRVYAENSKTFAVGNGTNTLSSGEIKSADCIFAGPENIEIETDLPDHVIIETSRMFSNGDLLSRYNTELGFSVSLNNIVPEHRDYFEYVEGENGESGYYVYIEATSKSVKIRNTSLTIGFKETDESGYNYQWQRATVENATEAQQSNIGQANSSLTINIQTPGWYRVKTTNTKNRKEVSNTSNVCMATFSPMIPTLSFDKDNIISATDETQDFEGNLCTISSKSQALITLAVAATLTDNGVNVINDPLYSTNIYYRWEKMDSGQNWVPYVSADANPDEWDFTSSVVKVPGNTATGGDSSAHQYRCFVENELGTDTVRSETPLNFKII